MALHSQWRAAPSEAFLRQPYEALAVNDGSPSYGSQQMLPTLTGPANFSTRYYDTGVDPRSLPPLGAPPPPPASMQQPRVLSYAKEPPPTDSDTGIGRSDNAARSIERRQKRSKKVSKGPPLADYARYLKDHMSRFFLWWGALCVAIVGIVTAFVAVEALSSEEFQTFSTLAWDCWFPSFLAMMLVLVVIAACSIAAAGLAFWVGWKESRPALRAFFVSSATLGLIVLCMALFAWLYRARARPFVISAANLLCQDVSHFGCHISTSLPPAPTAGPAAVPAQVPPVLPPTAPPPMPEPSAPEPPMPEPTGNSVRRLASAGGAWGRGAVGAAAAAGATSFALRLGGEGAAGLPGSSSVETRRLDSGKSALAFATSYGHVPDVAGVSELCRMMQKVCVPPADFDAATSCICSGAWRHTETVDDEVSDDTTLDESQERRRLQASQLRSSARRLEGLEAPGIWEGTQGAYCGAWEPDDDEGDWCFVSPYQECDEESKVTYKNGAGQIMTRSSGPCSDEVESRSQFVLDGLDAMAWPLELSAVLGLLLLTMSACGVLLYRVPSTQTVWTVTKRPEDSRDEAEVESFKPPREELSLEQRFNLAQKEAVRKMNDATPDEQRFAIYGFYMQAKSGDVRSDRPGFFNHRERAKWDSWAEHRGMTPEEAMEGYIQVVSMLTM